MPVMGGLKATKVIFDWEQNFRCGDDSSEIDVYGGELSPSVLVAAVTAFVDFPTVAKCTNAGMEEVFLKPVSSEKLKKFLATKYLQFCNSLR